MPWEIVRALGQQAGGPDVDARLWLFEVGRGEERRRIEVLITGQARDLSKVPEVRRAVETDGESAVVDALASLGEDEPPERITVAAQGIDP
jgi:hypothetical protein